ACGGGPIGAVIGRVGGPAGMSVTRAPATGVLLPSTVTRPATLPVVPVGAGGWAVADARTSAGKNTHTPPQAPPTLDTKCRMTAVTVTVEKDIAFEMAVSSVRFGAGVTREVGMDLKELGAQLVMVVTDPTVATLPPLQTVVDSLEQNGIAFAIYD